MKQLKKIFTRLAIAALMALSTGPLVSVPAYAAINTAGQQAACAGVSLSGADCSQNAQQGVGSIFKMVINILSVVVGAVAVIMITVAGFKYITSGGDSNRVASAKNTLIYALVGIVVAALAQFLVRFVLGQATK